MMAALIDKYATPQALMYLVLAACILALLFGTLRRSRHPDSPLSVEDLLLGDDGKMSKAATVMLGAFFLTSWMMVNLTMTGKMTEGYFLAYGALWITPTVTVLIKKG